MKNNTHKVPIKQWRRWPIRSRIVFNTVYQSMLRNPEYFLHPMAERVGLRLWKTTAWNAAWVAADASNGYQHTITARK